MTVSPPDTKTDVSDAPVDDVKTDAVVPADSSPADKGSEGDMLTAVKAALEPKTEKTPDSEEQGSKPETKADDATVKDGAEDGDGSDDLNEEELARLRPKTRKRIENLLGNVHARDAEIADLTPKAQQFEKISRFVEDAGLTKDEVNQGFSVMANLKNDPLKAYQELKPIFAQLQQIAGEVLTEDLQQAVNRGEITEGHARELALTRSRASINDRRLETTNQRRTEQDERDRNEAHVNDVAGKVTEWERSAGKNDPDWKLKAPRIQELVELELMRQQRADPKFFPNAEQAIKMSKDALEKVNAEMKRLAPQRRAIAPVTDVASSRSVASPTSMLDAVKAGLERAQAG